MKRDHPRLPLRATLAEAVRTVPEMWRGAGGVLGLCGALGVGAAMAPAGVAAEVAWAVVLVASLIAFSAVTRIGVAGGAEGARRLGLGPQGFQFGRTEARLAGAILLVGLFFSIILAVLGLTALAVFGAAGLNAEAVAAHDWAAAGPVWKLAVLGVVGAAILAVPIIFVVRLSLFAQATVGRGQMISLQATGLTNGSMAPLFVGLVLIETPKLLWAALVLGGVLHGRTAVLIWVLVLAAVQAPATASFLGAAYRRLERDQDGPAPI